MCYVDELLATLDTWGVSMVCAAGNNAVTVSGIIQYPALFADPSNTFYIKNIIVVGATDPDGNQGLFSQYEPWITTFAPGENSWLPETPTGGYNRLYGTSLCRFTLKFKIEKPPPSKSSNLQSV